RLTRLPVGDHLHPGRAGIKLTQCGGNELPRRNGLVATFDEATFNRDVLARGNDARQGRIRRQIQRKTVMGPEITPEADPLITGGSELVESIVEANRHGAVSERHMEVGVHQAGRGSICRATVLQQLALLWSERRPLPTAGPRSQTQSAQAAPSSGLCGTET